MAGHRADPIAETTMGKSQVIIVSRFDEQHLHPAFNLVDTLL
jgi:hypothetical protein